MSRLEAARCGVLVPRHGFDGRVLAVFAAACHVERDEAASSTGFTMFTMGSHRAGAGPATVQLGARGGPDLRAFFAAGEPVRCSHDTLRTPRIELPLAAAPVWHEPPPPPPAPLAEIAARWSRAKALLARARSARPSVIDGAGVVQALGAACRALDVAAAVDRLEGLIGWGEGSTPAGDDLLVGVFAAFDALLAARPCGGRSDAADEAFAAPVARRAFRDGLAVAVLARLARTTPISAHYLRLAAAGHFNAPVHAVRHALLGTGNAGTIDEALQTAFAIGATSGVDMVSGMLLGIQAWWPLVSPPR